MIRAWLDWLWRLLHRPAQATPSLPHPSPTPPEPGVAPPPLAVVRPALPVAKENKTMTENFEARELLESLKQLLHEMNWRFAEETERPALLMYMTGKNGLFPCTLQVMPDRPVIACYTYAQCRVPEEKRPAVAEFVARANYGLLLGNFELDLRDGEVRYKTSLALGDTPLSAELLEPVLRANLATADRYLPGLMSLLWNDLAPDDAVGLVEAA